MTCESRYLELLAQIGTTLDQPGAAWWRLLAPMAPMGGMRRPAGQRPTAGGAR